MERQRGPEVRDDVDVRAVLDPVQQAVGDLGDEGFQQGDAARHERGVHQGPQPRVVRWIDQKQRRDRLSRTAEGPLSPPFCLQREHAIHGAWQALHAAGHAQRAMYNLSIRAWMALSRQTL
ncbi:hypothetical protein ACFWVU_00500 [Streptomyces sp. NPDC058686]|uniref:hypothetical protein n=1 Tax=Streptomyces sp. NPDC058686 TaxID=3346599 RepID=UPI00364998FE